MLQAIRSVYDEAGWAVTLNYSTYISTSSEQEAATVARDFGCKVYVLADVIEDSRAYIVEGFLPRRFWEYATRTTTIVVINNNSRITAEELYKLLMREHFGESVILLAEKSVFDSDAGSFLRGLSKVGVPTEHIGCTSDQHDESYDLHVFTRCREIKNEQMFNLNICAG